MSIVTQYKLINGCVLLMTLVGCNSTPNSIIPSPFSSPSTTIPANKFPVYPPTSDWLPGLVFKGSVTEDELLVERTICQDLLPARTNPQTNKEEKYHTATLASVKGSTDATTKFSASLNPLETILGQNDVKFELAKFQKQKVVTIDPGEIKELKYIDSDQIRITEDGKAVYRDINPLCQAAMNTAENKEALKNKQIYLVTAVIAQTGIKYTFSKDIEFDSTLKADFKKILAASVKAGYTKSEKGGISEIGTESITTRSAAPEVITRWIRSGAIGGDKTTAKITIEPLHENINTIRGFEKLR